MINTVMYSLRSLCTKLANEGRKVAIVFENTDSFNASKKQPPAFIRKSRFAILHVFVMAQLVTHFAEPQVDNCALSTRHPEYPARVNCLALYLSRPRLIAPNRRFLHTTWIGGLFTRWFWRTAAEGAVSFFSIGSQLYSLIFF